MEDGWTQPVVLRRLDEHDKPERAGVEFVVVDGFHRWTLASTHAGIRATCGGLVPTVLIEADSVQRRMATVRHNRARGHHGVLHMGEIVTQLRDAGCSDEEIQRRLGMDPQEVSRLADTRGAAATLAKDSFGAGWVPAEKRRGGGSQASIDETA